MSNEQSSRFIAIVDDDRSVQTALEDLIESEGLSTLCFGSAEQFLDSGAQHKAVCLIADIRMPGMSGLELQTKLKAERAAYRSSSSRRMVTPRCAVTRRVSKQATS
jgi:FixJ family two-component response regulator